MMTLIILRETEHIIKVNKKFINIIKSKARNSFAFFNLKINFFLLSKDVKLIVYIIYIKKGCQSQLVVLRNFNFINLLCTNLLPRDENQTQFHGITNLSTC